jgi:hypothetical protein
MRALEVAVSLLCSISNCRKSQGVVQKATKNKRKNKKKKKKKKSKSKKKKKKKPKNTR